MGSRRSYNQYCSVACALDLIGDRWTLLVIRELMIGPRRFTDLLGGLPGIGPKSAQRLAFYILRSSKNDAEALTRAISKVKESVKFCKSCNNLSDEDTCEICKSKSRDRSLLCIVEEPNDIIAIERAREYNGIYHVLLGSLSPLDGIGPSDLKVKELLNSNIRFSANPTVSNVPVAIDVKRYNENIVYFINRKDALQSNIYFMVNGSEFVKEEVPYMEAFNSYFGGGFSGLVLQEIREYRSMAYSASASF